MLLHFLEMDPQPVTVGKSPPPLPARRGPLPPVRASGGGWVLTARLAIWVIVPSALPPFLPRRPQARMFGGSVETASAGCGSKWLISAASQSPESRAAPQTTTAGRWACLFFTKVALPMSCLPDLSQAGAGDSAVFGSEMTLNRETPPRVRGAAF